MVNPIPDEPALQIGVTIDHIPEVHEVPGTVSHGMGIFRHDIRAIRLRVAPFLQRGCARVLRAVDVRVPFEKGSLVLYGTCRVLGF